MKVKTELMEKYSEAKTYKSKPERRNGNVNADYFYSSAKTFELVACSRTELIYDKPACECKCLLIFVLPA